MKNSCYSIGHGIDVAGERGARGVVSGVDLREDHRLYAGGSEQFFEYLPGRGERYTSAVVRKVRQWKVVRVDGVDVEVDRYDGVRTCECGDGQSCGADRVGPDCGVVEVSQCGMRRQRAGLEAVGIGWVVTDQNRLVVLEQRGSRTDVSQRCVGGSQQVRGAGGVEDSAAGTRRRVQVRVPSK